MELIVSIAILAIVVLPLMTAFVVSLRTNAKAKKYDEVSIDEFIAKNLQVVDMTASILARDNKMPMWVFGLNEENSIVNTIKGKFSGTKVTV